MMFNDPTYPLFTVFSGIAVVLALIPLPWHLQAWNAGTCLYMIWTALSNLNLFVNSIVWHGNALNPVPVWCDISSRFIVGSAVAIPAASLCINRRLFKIASSHTVSVSKAQKRRAVMEDLAIGLGIPIIEMALQYIVEGHRFNIFEDIGCFPATYNVWLSYLLVGAWPIAIGLVSAVYCILTLRAFYMRHAQFAELLSSNSSLTRNRYFRLMALATIELICTTPFAAYSIYLNATTEPIQPYISWSDTHFNYSHVEQFPATIWRLNHQRVVSLELSRWMVVVCSFIFFLFFGFAAEARRHYQATLASIMKALPFRRATKERPRFSSPSLPQFREKKAQSGSQPTVTGILPVFITKADMPTRSSMESSTTRADTSFSLPSPISGSLIGSKADIHEHFGHAI